MSEFTWISKRTCNLNYGEKVPNVGVRPSRDKSRFIADWSSGLGSRRFRRFKKMRFDGHRAGDLTLYGYGNGNPKQQFTLFMFDVDVHKVGNRDTAWEAGLWLQETFGCPLEESTNGVGVHGYGVLDKQGLSAGIVNVLLKRLEAWLAVKVREKGFVVDKIEIKGLCTELVFSEGEFLDVHFGSLFKLPRSLSLMMLEAIVPLTAESLAGCEFDVPDGERVVERGGSGGFVSEEMIDEWCEISGWWVPDGVRMGKGRVSSEEVGVFLALCEWFSARENVDQSLPLARFMAVWENLVMAGATSCRLSMQKLSACFGFCRERGVLVTLDESYGPGRAKKRRVLVDEVRGSWLARCAPKSEEEPPTASYESQTEPAPTNLVQPRFDNTINQNIYAEYRPVMKLKPEIPPASVMRNIRDFTARHKRRSDQPYVAALCSIALQHREYRLARESCELTEKRLKNFLTDFVLKHYNTNEWIGILRREIFESYMCTYWTVQNVTPVQKPDLVSLVRRLSLERVLFEPALYGLISPALPIERYSVEGITLAMQKAHQDNL